MHREASLKRQKGVFCVQTRLISEQAEENHHLEVSPVPKLRFPELKKRDFLKALRFSKYPRQNGKLLPFPPLLG